MPLDNWLAARQPAPASCPARVRARHPGRHPGRPPATMMHGAACVRARQGGARRKGGAPRIGSGGRRDCRVQGAGRRRAPRRRARAAPAAGRKRPLDWRRARPKPPSLSKVILKFYSRAQWARRGRPGAHLGAKTRPKIKQTPGQMGAESIGCERRCARPVHWQVWRPPMGAHWPPGAPSRPLPSNSPATTTKVICIQRAEPPFWANSWAQ